MGQFDASLAIGSQGTNFATAKETFSALVGLQLTNGQFVRAIATASIAKTQIANIAAGGFAAWNILDVDAFTFEYAVSAAGIPISVKSERGSVLRWVFGDACDLSRCL
jgi:hypothetical protein